MPTGTIAPPIKHQFFDDNGDPLAFGQLYCYAAGTNTHQPVYRDAALTVPHPQPAVLDANGRITLFLSATTYRFVPKDQNGVAVTDGEVDNVSALAAAGSVAGVDTAAVAGEALAANESCFLSDGSGGLTAGRWYRTDADDPNLSTLPRVRGVATAAIDLGASGFVRLEGALDGFVGLVGGAVYYASTAVGAITAAAPARPVVIGVALNATTLLITPVVSLTTTSVITTVGVQVALPLPPGAGALTIFLNNPTLLTLQGIAAGLDGQELTLISIGGGQVNLANQDAGAAVALRIINGVTGTISLAASTGRARLQYDGATARWRVLQHEQGAWITQAFNAGDFTSSSGSWTVGGGDVGKFSYYLRGRTLSVAFTIDVTTVAGGPTQLFIKTPGGFTNAPGALYGACWLSDNGAPTIGRVTAVSGDTRLQIVRSDVAAFAAAVDTTAVFGSITFEVQ